MFEDIKILTGPYLKVFFIVHLYIGSLELDDHNPLFQLLYYHLSCLYHFPSLALSQLLDI
jgi:hypothetical protein